MGFTFDDNDSKGIATPLNVMHRLLEDCPHYSEVIMPYIGGKEVNTHPSHKHSRYVINFGERDLEECKSKWPQLVDIVEEKVRPERINKNARKYPRMVNEWWKYWNSRPELHTKIRGLDRVLAVSYVGQHATFAFLPTGTKLAGTLIIYPIETYGAFCTLQARPHDTWARFFGSSMKDDLRYTPSDCFETFPFPENWETLLDVEAVGKEYYGYRAALMVRNGEGLTKTYNRFHDPHESASGVVELRRLHREMDRVVLDAYGWTDIPTECEFLLDYEIDEETWNPRRRKPYRYRWPDDVRDEVLGRLLELNATRAAEEAQAGFA